MKMDNYKYEKISTGIYGLDKLLFGGIQLQPEKIDSTFSIVICGGNGMNKALFGVQLLQGITKSLKLQKKTGLGDPYIISKSKNRSNLEDLFLDYIISKCINKIKEDVIESNENWLNNNFTNRFFNIKEKDEFSINYKTIDRYIGMGIVVYNSRINALVMASPYKFNDSTSEEEILIIAERKAFQNIKFSDKLGDDLDKQLFPIEMIGKDEDCELLKNKRIPCILIEGRDDFSDVKKCNPPQVQIEIVDNKDNIGDLKYKPDIVFSLRYKDVGNSEYLINQLKVSKSAIQTTALGWHQYKKRDYGIEVYPSLHLLMQRKRYMPMGVLMSDYSILDETYQQFLDYSYAHEDKTFLNIEASKRYLEEKLEIYRVDREKRKWNCFKDLYESYQQDECIGNIMEDIFINPNQSGRCTAIIGAPNTYKRYLVTGGTFSACFRQEHTLDILLEKDESIIRKRMDCPAMKNVFNIFDDCTKEVSEACQKCKGCKIYSCYQCYGYIHFKSIRMGYISPDEFIYYLLLQLRLSKGKKKIKHIIIDDLEMIDYSFPLLKQDDLFLTALISICKENGIDLFILICNKDACKTQELRALSDNVICIERKDKDIKIYIERYYGYNDPSHIFGGKIKISDMQKLFYCEKEKKDMQKFGFSKNLIDPIYVDNMDNFWVKNDTNKIVKALLNKKNEK